MMAGDSEKRSLATPALLRELVLALVLALR